MRLDRVIGIVKAYTTRVGEGPFPTELHDDFGELLRKTGAEYGTTTGRPRRCGWYDAVIARYAARVNGVTDFTLTKLDVLTGLEKVPVCVAYDVDGVRHDEMPVNQSDFHHAVPIYEELPGWWEDISEARTLDDLPKNARDYVSRGRGDVRRADLGDRRRPGPRPDRRGPRPGLEASTTSGPVRRNAVDRVVVRVEVDADQCGVAQQARALRPRPSGSATPAPRHDSARVLRNQSRCRRTTWRTSLSRVAGTPRPR